MSRLTIKYIAELAGISPSAVSIVLNDRPGVSAETRERVRAILRETGYVPNPNSRRLLFNKSDNITILLNRDMSDLGNQFYVELNNLLVPECDKAGANPVYAFYRLHDSGDVELPQIITRRDTGGIIFLGAPPEPVQRRIIETEIPFVITDTHEPRPGIASVYTDYSAAAYMATKYLISLGHHNIGYLGYDSPLYMRNTLRGFKCALQDGGCEYHPEWVHSSPNSDKLSYETTRRMMKTPRLPSAIFCTGDFIAIGCLQFILQDGLRVPEDISLISIDDIILSRYVTPRLTTVKIDRQELARQSIALLVDRMSGVPSLPEHIEVPCGEIEVRQSVCAHI